MRYYTTKPLNGGITFHCIFCEHSVATVDFDHAKGNRRTQAAAAINHMPKNCIPLSYGALSQTNWVVAVSSEVHITTKHLSVHGVRS